MSIIPKREARRARVFLLSRLIRGDIAAPGERARRLKAAAHRPRLSPSQGKRSDPS